MTINDILADSVRKDVKRFLFKIKGRKPSKPGLFPNKWDTPDQGYRNGSSKRFGQD